MRHKDPELMNQIRDFAEDYYLTEGHSPSTTEIGEAVGIARGTAYKYLVAMDEQGMISYDGSEILTEKIERITTTRDAVVYTGSVPCGSPETVEAMIEDYVSLPVSIFGSDEMYILRTRGDSMIEAGIEEGDYVVIKKHTTANIGDIVVALHDNENTLKTLRYDQNRRIYILHPENADMEDIEVDDLTIQGVAKFVIKAL